MAEATTAAPPAAGKAALAPSRIEFLAPVTVHTSSVGSYVTYPIVVEGGSFERTNLRNEDGSQLQRRYRHFSWLHARLHDEVPGAIVQVLPDKALTGNKNPTLVSKRKAELAAWLSSVLAHDELRQAPSLMTFMSEPDFEAAIRGSAAGTVGEGEDGEPPAEEPKKRTSMFAGWGMPSLRAEKKEDPTPADLEVAALAESVARLASQTAALRSAMEGMTNSRLERYVQLDRWVQGVSPKPPITVAEEQKASPAGDQGGEAAAAGDETPTRERRASTEHAEPFEVAGLTPSMKVFSRLDVPDSFLMHNDKEKTLLCKMLNERQAMLKAAKAALDTRERERKKTAAVKVDHQTKVEALATAKQKHQSASAYDRQKKADAVDVALLARDDAARAVVESEKRLAATTVRLQREWARVCGEWAQLAKLTLLEASLANERLHQLTQANLASVARDLQALNHEAQAQAKVDAEARSVAKQQAQAEATAKRAAAAEARAKAKAEAAEAKAKEEAEAAEAKAKEEAEAAEAKAKAEAAEAKDKPADEAASTEAATKEDGAVATPADNAAAELAV